MTFRAFVRLDRGQAPLLPITHDTQREPKGVRKLFLAEV